MMRQVILEGDLGEKYGNTWSMKANTYSDIFECIEANYPGFRSDIITHVDNGSDFAIQAGADYINEEDLKNPLSEETIIITPIPAGAKSGGAKILVGAALLAAVFFLPVMPGATTLAAAAAAKGASVGTLMAANAVIGLGLNLVLAGLQQILAPDPSVDQNEQNYLFDGPTQTIIAGQPVPYLFGRKLIPGTPISSSIIVGTLPTNVGYYYHPRVSTGGSFNTSGNIDYNMLYDSDLNNIDNLRNLSLVYTDIT